MPVALLANAPPYITSHVPCVSATLVIDTIEPLAQETAFGAVDFTLRFAFSVTFSIHAFKSNISTSYTMTSLSQPSATTASYIALSVVSAV